MHLELNKKLHLAFDKVYKSNSFILGKGVEAFEKDYARFNNVKHCIGTGNGFDALYLSLKALQIKPGDEVIVPAHTYIASALPVSHCGASPVFVDADPITMNIDSSKIVDALSDRTKAIIIVHLYGQPCDMEPILSIASKYNLFIIEDNAHAQGAKWRGRITGSIGHINATSFYPTKNLGALGDGGCITTSDDELAERTRMLHNYGSKVKYFHEILGFNSRLDELQSAILSQKLRRLKRWNEERNKIAAIYSDLLISNKNIILPFIQKECTSVFHQYIIRTTKRNQLQKYLADNGIGTLIHYPIPVHLQPAYKELGYKKGAFPIAEEICNTCLSLPIYPGLTVKEIRYIANKINSFSFA